jgi:DNA repair protein RecN (Recombination protein N)
MNAGKLQAAIVAAFADVGGERGAERLIGQALRGLDRIRDAAEGRLDPAVGGLERALAELTEALRCLAAEGRALGENPRRLNDVEERLFALREIARKHNVPVDALAELRQRLGQRLAEAATAEDRLARLREAAAAARGRYAEAAATLSEVRRTTAKRLDKRVAAELPPLKLEKAKFRTAISRSDETDWSAHGTDRIAFEAATNPGSEAGPLAKIASGGELARFMLALKVVLAEAAPADTLVFDEVDAGVGGAVADAVGERLARLARQLQVLVVTHSPQVAARVDEHWRVTKELSGRGSVTRLLPLDADARREEIARMLSGAEVTDAARAAADSLIAGGRR